MTVVQSIGAASDRVLERLVEGLEIEFGHGAGEALARRFLEAEEVDFRWDARVSERWLGAYESLEDENLELDRVAICGRLDREWFMATMIIDGDGGAYGMLACRAFGTERAAREALTGAH